MDPLDLASDRAQGYQRLGTDALPPTVERPLTGTEFAALVEHLLDTELSILDALRALHHDVRQLTLDDLDRVAAQIARCRHCNTWTPLSHLVQSTCPDCLAEQDGQ